MARFTWTLFSVLTFIHLFAVWDCAGQATSKPAEVTAVMTVDELIQHLLVAEQPIRNLTVAEFELTEEFRPAGTTVWEKTPYQMSGTAYFGDPAGGAVRLDISREIFPAQPDLLKWEETAYSIGFDGASGHEVIYKYGGIGHPISALSASTFKSMRQVLDYSPRRWATGIEFSTHYVLNEGDRFSAAIKRLVKQGTPGIVDRVKLDGRDLIRYRFPPVHTGTLWFDPNRNYTLIAHEVIHNGQVEQSDRVTELVEATPGVWYPIAATHEGPSESTAKGTQRYSYRARKVVANDPAFDAKIFTVPIPANHPVQAERNFSTQKHPDSFNPPTPPGAVDNALRVKSANNLRHFGQIMILYENEFNGLYPLDLATGVKAERPIPEVLKSPMGDEKVGYDYIYLHYKGMGRPFPVPDDAVVAYDAPDAAKNGGACVLFGDGHVDWLDAAQLKAALGKTEAERPRS